VPGPGLEEERVTQYTKGRRFEWKLAAQLKADGALVMRSAGSHGDADLIALYLWGVVAIQAKTRKPVAAEIRKIAAASKQTGVNWLLVWPDGRRILYRHWKYGKETEWIGRKGWISATPSLASSS
jgi:hypothetical protein